MLCRFFSIAVPETRLGCLSVVGMQVAAGRCHPENLDSKLPNQPGWIDALYTASMWAPEKPVMSYS